MSVIVPVLVNLKDRNDDCEGSEYPSGSTVIRGQRTITPSRVQKVKMPVSIFPGIENNMFFADGGFPSGAGFCFGLRLCDCGIFSTR